MRVKAEVSFNRIGHGLCFPHLHCNQWPRCVRKTNNSKMATLRGTAKNAVFRYRQKKYSIQLLTASIGLPFTRAPKATAHQKVQTDGSMGYWFPSKALLLPSVVTASNWPRSQEPVGESEGCPTNGRAMTLIIASRM